MYILLVRFVHPFPPKKRPKSKFKKFPFLILLNAKKQIVGFHVTSLQFKLKTIHPSEISLLRCIRAAEN